MQIRCKEAPITLAWADPKKRFFFHDKGWRNINHVDLSTLKKKLKEKFNTVFDLRDGPVYQATEQVTEDKKSKKRKFI